MSEIKVLYFCDKLKCEYCHDYNPCAYTLDINHAVNRDSLEGRKFMCIGECDPSIITFIEMREES